MNYSDGQLLKAILSGDPRQRDWALYQFYAFSNWVVNYVKDHGGRHEDGEDVFQEALILLDRNIREGRFEGKSSLKTYFLGIAKWRWVSNQRKVRQLSELEPGQYDGEIESVEARILEDERKVLLKLAVQALDPRCQALLKYYKLDYSMKEIQALLGFSSPEMAKKQAYRCRERLRQVFMENPGLLKALSINI